MVIKRDVATAIIKLSLNKRCATILQILEILHNISHVQSRNQPSSWHLAPSNNKEQAHAGTSSSTIRHSPPLKQKSWQRSVQFLPSPTYPSLHWHAYQSWVRWHLPCTLWHSWAPSAHLQLDYAHVRHVKCHLSQNCLKCFEKVTNSIAGFRVIENLERQRC